MGGPPDPDWYFEHVLYYAEPGRGGPVEVGPALAWRAWWRQQAASPSEPLTTAARHGFVLTTRQACALGATRSAQRTAVRRGRWSSPMPGVVAPLCVDDADEQLARRRRHALLAAGTSLHRPGHVVAARSAAVLCGLPVLSTPDHAELLAPNHDGLGRRSSGHYFGAALSAPEITDWFGVAVTTVARTLVDLARHNRRDAIMAADAALRERLVSPAELVAALSVATGWPGVRQARAVLALADPRAESPLESITRLALHDDGFPPPEPQFEIGGYRVDFCWPAQRLILEADGRGKYTDDASWRERKREAALRRLGWRIERVIWDEITRGWRATSARLWAALAGR